ncbi:protein commissureless 2 homolog [Anopheles ziemanni]|uniref:protein commissureless 2 homolog n=1 Tax=Anopheles coustani TaxID=139045 RepID=UPI002658D1E4|nr:protein commissureless 2 homolog [Anopheles coustani]XP_058171269.1 protein commissureless 2 homolog [Anopheles ziemanni]
MIENFESKITFEIPTNLDFDKLIRGNNYTLFWQNLHQQQQQQQSMGAGAARIGSGALGMAGAAAAAAVDGGFGGFGGSSASSSLFGGIDYSNGSSDYSLLNSLQSFANRGRDGGMGGSDQMLDPTYERFIGDVWVGIVLTLMILSSIFCMCSCFLYHKFRQWQRNVLTARSQTLSSMDIETPPPYDVESLPSYTIVSGLPSYQDAIEQLKQKRLKYYEPVRVHRPSVMKLFESQDLLANGPAVVSASPNPAHKLEEIRYTFARPLSVNEMPIAVEGTSQLDTTTGETVVPPPATSVPSSTTTPPPPPPYKSQISTISTTSSTAGSTVVHAPCCGVAGSELSGAIRGPQKKIGVCHYTVENERAAGRS